MKPARATLAGQLRLREVQILLAVLAIGAVLRAVLLIQWRPGFIGYPDTGAYILDAFDPSYPFLDPLRVAGYGIFIRGLHDLSANLSLVVVVQHAMGLATALCCYLIVRRLGVRSRWVAVLPAAVVALGGSQILFEHAILTETLWMFLVTAALLAVVSAGAPGTRLVACAAAALAGGLLLGVSVPVRLPSLFVLPVFLLWLLAAGSGPLGRRALASVLLLAGFAAPVYGYASWHKAETGRSGLTRNGALNFYGRVAPWADCKRFTPPAGTEFLCESSPIQARGGHEGYVFATGPAVTRFATGNLTNVLPAEGSKQLVAWSRAAVLGQPLTYLGAVAMEARRVIDPDAEPGLPSQRVKGGYGMGPSEYPALLESPDRDGYVLPNIAANYPGGGLLNRGDLAWFNRYESIVRPPSWLMALAIVLALLAPFVARGPERRAAWLLTPIALLLLFGPVATSLYDYRYVFPTFGFLAAAGGIGAWAVLVAARGWVSGRRVARRAPLEDGRAGIG